MHHTRTLNEELQHPKEALARFKYPQWAINKVQNKVINGNWEENCNNHVGNTAQGTNGTSDNSQASSTPRGRPTKGHMVIPYVQGLGETIKHTCGRYGIQHILKATGTLKQILVKPKDKDPKEKKSGVIYCYQCTAIDCGEEYISEPSRTLGGEVQRTPKGALPHPGAQQSYRAPTQPGQLQYNRQIGAGHHSKEADIYNQNKSKYGRI